MWTQSRLDSILKAIRTEISLFETRWEIKKVHSGEVGLSTCVAKLGTASQQDRRYDITVNEDNPLNYTISVLTSQTRVEVGLIHEKTHAICDMSYTCNHVLSKLGVWNNASGEFSEEDPGAHAQRDRMEALDTTIDADPEFQRYKDDFQPRIGYAYGNLSDIDPVVNELLFVCSYLGVSKNSPFMDLLISTAEFNLANRDQGRREQANIR
jgi:hypothetical protein